MVKKFKDNEAYFKFINKHKEKIKVINVKPITKKNSDYKINLIYENKG